MSQGLFAVPLEITDPRACDFYHTIDLPDSDTIVGAWDLRRNVDRYLGKTDFRGKRVLDVGSATGFLTFHVEGKGAEVVSYDLSEDYAWDVVPFAGTDFREVAQDYRARIRRINRGYWYCHRALGSRARKVYGTVYGIPEAIGPVDVAIFGSILLHLRDPFLALQKALQITKDTVIVTDMLPRRQFYQAFLGWLGRPRMTFLPEVAGHKHGGTWWELSPAVIRRFLNVLGFGKTKVTYHRQIFNGQTRLLFTVVGQRTRKAPIFAGQTVEAA